MYPDNNQKAVEVADDLPFISIIIPFELKMNTKTGFDDIVNKAVAKTERELIKSYPEDTAMPIVKKLHRVLMGLDHKAHNKSIALFISPLLEKVYYFTNTPVEMNNYAHLINQQLCGSRSPAVAGIPAKSQLI